MAEYEPISGNTYSATFFPKGVDTEGLALAYAVIEPPIDVDACNELIQDHMIVTAEVTPYARTEKKTVIQILEDENPKLPFSEDERMERFYTSLVSIVNRLNEIEDGNFPERE